MPDFENLLETSLLNRKIKRQQLNEQDKQLVNTAIRLVTDYEPIRLNKVADVRRNKSFINQAIASKANIGFKPSRLNSFPSYLVFHIVKLFSTLYAIPDKKLIIPGVSDLNRLLMSSYLDKVMHDGGYHEALTGGWGGNKNMALNGDVVLGMGLGDSGKQRGMPVYNQIPIQNCSFTPLSRGIRTKTGLGEVGRFAYTIYLTLQAAEHNFPGILDIALPGDIPSWDQLENNAELSLDQIGVIKKNEAIQIMIFTDKDFEVTAIIAGANAALYKRLDGKEFPYKMTLDGYKQPYLNIVKGSFESLPDGLYGAGVGDMFGTLADIETKIFSSQTNNLLDNLNAPPIINIPGVEAASIFAQEKMARNAIKEGKRAMMAFDAVDNNGQKLGQASVDYLRNIFPERDVQPEINRINDIVRRSGWNLDFLFTNPNSTNFQSSLDIEANNKNVMDIQSKNLDFYKRPVEFAIDAIRKNGNVNDKTVFATDLEVDIQGDKQKLGDMLDKVGSPALTQGDIVQMFKDNTSIDMEIDIKSGVAFNKTLERRSLREELQLVAPGSPRAIQLGNALAMLNGGAPSTKESLTDPQGNVGVPNAPQQLQQSLSL